MRSFITEQLASRIVDEVLREMTTDGAAGGAGGGFGTVVDPPENWAQDSDDGSGPSGNKSPDAYRFDPTLAPLHGPPAPRIPRPPIPPGRYPKWGPPGRIPGRTRHYDPGYDRY
jgi:hypothetical protein